MKVTTLTIPEVLLIEPEVFKDDRGFFTETYNKQRYSAIGLPEFVQDNHSKSSHGTLRGLHYQLTKPQGKLVRVTQGEVFDVAVDIRVNSPNFGKWVGVTLSAENHKQLYIPEGFAHGFCVTSDSAEFHYKCTNFYAPDDSHSIAWNDPTCNITWPIGFPLLSKQDANAQRLLQIVEQLPTM